MVQYPIKSHLKAAINLPRALNLARESAPGWLLINLLLILIQSVLPLLALIMLKQVVDALGAAIASPIDTSFSDVAFWIGMAGLVALASIATNIIAGYASEVLSMEVSDHVADVMHAKSITADLGYYEDSTFHDTLHRAQKDAPFRPASIVNGLKQTLQSSLTLLGIVGLLFTFHWAVGLALLLAALPAGILRLVYARQLFSFERSRAELERQAWYYHWIVSSLDYARDVRLFGVGRLFADRFAAIRRQLREGRLKISAKRSQRDMLAQGVATLVLYGTLISMAFYAIQGGMTIGVIVMYFQGYQRALTALQNVLQGLAWLYEDNLFLKHFYEFLDLPCHIEQTEGNATPAPPTSLGLVCENLHFTYPNGKQPTLQGVDLQIRPGEVVALVGVNGAGKTTLAKLLCRLYDPAEGTISWEGEALTAFQPRAWRRQVSVVSQEFPHFDLTIGENIWLGDIDKRPDPDELLAAARKSGSDALIERFPDGLDTLLGTQFRSGQELSVGEWQRLALARAWYRDAHLLILDEPSSALDPLAEADLIRSFRKVIGRRSALIISHRLSTARLADRIYVMADGRTLESGSHERLLQKNGAYARFFRTQAEHYQT